MSKNSSDVVITSALRTPIGRYKGSLKNLSASKLGSIAIKEVIYKSKLDLEEIDEVIMGHVLLLDLVKILLDKLQLVPEYQFQNLLTLLIRFVDLD